MSAVAVASALAPQIFANNPLNRSSNERKDPDFIAGALQNCQIIMVAGIFSPYWILLDKTWYPVPENLSLALVEVI